jgi:hypothetical protein
MIHEMNQLLAEMQLLPHGTITNYSPTGTAGAADSKLPTGESRPPHLYWARRWELAVARDEETEQREGAKVTKARTTVLEAARAELEAWRHRPADAKSFAEPEQSEDARMISEGKGWPVGDVAQKFRCTPTRVRRVRLKAGVSVTNGKGATLATVDTTNQREHARELAENGATERQIEFITKLPKTTVRRVLGRAA